MTAFLKNIKYIEHYTIWVFMYVMVFDYHFFENNWGEALLTTLLEIGLYMLVFYFNYRVAIPKVLERKGRWAYVLVIILFFVSYVFLIKVSGWEARFYEESYLRNLLSMTINFGLFWFISTLFWYYKKQQHTRENELQMRAEKLAAEMKFLKNQISPHFIFNTLNNIYSLVQQKHDNAAPMLAKLSKILRYLIYESAQKEVALNKEIATIQQYIELQLLRKPLSQNVDFYQEGARAQHRIVPLLLLNFVENSFKHGNLDLSEEAWIKISCMVEENQLLFKVENSRANTILHKDEKGIGNQNIRRQLELNYPNKYSLEVVEEKTFYAVEVVIDL